MFSKKKPNTKEYIPYDSIYMNSKLGKLNNDVWTQDGGLLWGGGGR